MQRLPESPDTSIEQNVRRGGEINGSIQKILIALSIAMGAAVLHPHSSDTSDDAAYPVVANADGSMPDTPSEADRARVRELIDECLQSMNLKSSIVATCTLPTSRMPSAHEFHTVAQSMDAHIQDELNSIALFLYYYPKEYPLICDCLQDTFIGPFISKGTVTPEKTDRVREVAGDFLHLQNHVPPLVLASRN